MEKERSGVQFANVGSTPTNLDDMITQDLLDLMHSHANNLQLRRNALEAQGGRLASVHRAMAQQRAFDRRTMDEIVGSLF